MCSFCWNCVQSKSGSAPSPEACYISQTDNLIPFSCRVTTKKYLCLSCRDHRDHNLIQAPAILSSLAIDARLPDDVSVFGVQLITSRLHRNSSAPRRQSCTERRILSCCLTKANPLANSMAALRSSMDKADWSSTCSMPTNRRRFDLARRSNIEQAAIALCRLMKPAAIPSSMP